MRRAAGDVIWCIIITRGDVQRVVDAFILEETLYWWLHPIERVQTVRGMDAWDGYHWTLARQLAQDEDWVSLKAYMDILGETYLRESMEYLVQSASPRLFHEYWAACPAEENDEDDPPPNDPAFVKTGVGSGVCWPKRPKSAINWDAINGINEWEPKVPRVITDVSLDRGNDDPTTQ